MRLVFAGTPEPAVPTLRRLAASDHDVVAVVTRPDAPLGRRRTPTPSPVAVAAAELELDTVKAARLDDDATARIRETRPDLGVVVAYGGLVREPLLSLPRHGWINLHFSLLPRWRGAAPVQHALMAGDPITGSTVFRLVPELDAGDVYAQRATAVPAAATTGDLLAALAEDGAELTADVVDAIAAGTATATPQAGEVTLAPKLTDRDGAVDWTRPRDVVLDRIRGVTPEPGAHTTAGVGRLKILAAAPAPADAPTLAAGATAVHGRAVLVGTGTAPVVLERVQPAGRSPMAAADWWRGLRGAIERLGA